MFFQRLRFDLAELQSDHATLERAIAEVGGRFSMRYRMLYAKRPKRIAIFVSRYDHCLYDLFLRHRGGELPCDIALVVSNHPDLAPVAREFGVRFELFPITPETKGAQEKRELELLESERVDLVVLARYMQILGEGIVNRFEQAVINIHHSFLPAFVGQKPYHQAHERGVKLIGATAHYATKTLDEGPIIEQDVARASHKDSIEDLVRKGRDLEKVVLARAVRWHLDDRILVYGNKTVVFD
jgi:formyltetrahydrofolate deformylase